MKLLLRQRIFSWFDSYDIYDENDEPVFTVQGKLSWGHRLEITDAAGNELGRVQEEIHTFLPRFSLYLAGQEAPIGQVRKEFSFFKPVYTLDCCGWQIQGDWLGWDYEVTDGSGRLVMQLSKELLHFSDTYVLDIQREEDALLCLMIVLSIDAANCSDN